MGRKLMRVPLDFDWPLKQVWKGYVNPHHSLQCRSCGGTGLNEKTKALSDLWYGFDNPNRDAVWSNNITQDDVNALMEADRLWDFTRVPINDEQRKIVKEKKKNGGNSWLPESNGYTPTADEVNKWNRKTMGHDAINQSVCVKARAKREGYYGYCPYCNGEGEIWASDEISDLHESWQSFDPPDGDGFQLWETTSEGSPESPVFETLDELCTWCETNATTFANYKATKEEWKQMLDDDFVCHQQGNMIFM